MKMLEDAKEENWGKEPLIVSGYRTNENQKELFAFSKQHKDVWKELSLKQFGGKYSKYAYDFFQRGRVYYNSATKQYSVVMNDLRKDIPKTILNKIYELFEIN